MMVILREFSIGSKVEVDKIQMWKKLKSYKFCLI